LKILLSIGIDKIIIWGTCQVSRIIFLK